MDDNTELVWRMFLENMTNARHHETQRATVTSALLIIAGAIVTVITAQLKNGTPHWSLSVLLITVGAVGIPFNSKLFERYSLYRERARTYRIALDQLLPGARIDALKLEADDRHKSDFPRLHRVGLNRLWIGPPAIIMGVGVVLLITTLLTNN